MAILRTDRERMVLGDRVIDRQALFAELDEAVARVHGQFRQTHTALSELLHTDKDDDGEQAAQEHEQAVNDVTRLYRWAYNQVTAWLTPDWNAYVSDEQITAARERLFPMGNPSVVLVSQQYVLDSVSHLVTALKQEKAAKYPQTFFEELSRARENLVATVAALSQTPKETTDASPEHRTARTQWDKAYAAMHEVTRGFLRIADRFDQLDQFFGPKIEEQTDDTSKASEAQETEEPQK